MERDLKLIIVGDEHIGKINFILSNIREEALLHKESKKIILINDKMDIKKNSNNN